MRLTRNELMERYPSWNEAKHDIVKVFYGDIPLIEWNKAEYEKYSQLEGTLANIEAVEAYIWTQNGDYSIYRTLIGDIKIGASGAVLCGDLQVKYGGKVYSIYLNLMYGLKSLSIFRNSGAENFIGFSNADGLSSPCIKSRYYISPTPKTGFKPVGGFKDANGNLQDKIYLAAYEGCVYDSSAGTYCKDDTLVADFATDMLSSIASAKPASGLSQVLTRANARKMANNRGTGWQLSNIFSLSATQWLILVEYASFDAQSKIGKGVSTFTDDGTTNMSVITGATAGVGNGSGIPDGGTDGQCSVSYRGEENLWGNIWTWLDGINIYNTATESTVYVKEFGTMADDTADGYTALGFSAKNGSGYISAFGIDEDLAEVFIPVALAGSSTLPVGDYFWNAYTGWRVAILGGKWHSGSYCGAWCLYWDSASSYRGRNFGGRLLYVPQTSVAA